MKLAFYGGGDGAENLELDREVMKLLPKNPLFTLIPATSYESHIDFKEFTEQYKKYGVTRFIHFPIDVPLSPVMLKEVLKSDLIHLGGGNTYYFLHHLRKKKLFPLLKKFAKDQGVLTGLSAGAIMMTPSIETAGFPSFDRDDNDDDMKNLKAMSLVPFEFYPHYEDKKAYIKAMIDHSLTISHPLFCCPDGSGVVLQGDDLKFVGDVWMFEHGAKFKINSRNSKT